MVLLLTTTVALLARELKETLFTQTKSYPLAMFSGLENLITLSVILRVRGANTTGPITKKCGFS
jgi:hypothetical protein